MVAPSKLSTDGLFKDIGVDIEDTYVVVARTFNGTTKYFVEVFESALFTDCAFTGGVATTITGLPHIAKSLNVIADGSVLSNETVSGGGSITMDRASTTSYEVGLPFDPRLSAGVRTGFVKRVVEVNAILYKTQHLLVNGNLVPIRTFDTQNILDNDMPEFTGTKTVSGISGYDQDGQITISQNLPLKLNLLGLEYKLSVYGGT